MQTLAPLQNQPLPDIELFGANFIAQLRSKNGRKPAADASPRDKRLEANARRRKPCWPYLGLSQSKGSVEALCYETFARMANSARSYIGDKGRGVVRELQCLYAKTLWITALRSDRYRRTPRSLLPSCKVVQRGVLAHSRRRAVHDYQCW